MAWSETTYHKGSKAVSDEEVSNFWYKRGLQDGDKFETVFDFQPWWGEYELVHYWKGWRVGKDKMIAKVCACNGGD